jgi:ElaB/YqjD/DUF883 family membrane-anchored ribosome-binding protein
MDVAQHAGTPAPHPETHRPPPSGIAAQLEDVDLDEVQEKLTEFDRQARGFIKRNPLVALAGAVTVGFLVGRLVSR